MNLRSKTLLGNFVWLALAVVCAGNIGLAQGGRGGLSGLVTDQSGAVVVGAPVKAENLQTGVFLSTVTTKGGLYSFVSLTPSTYQLTVTQKGFETAIQDNVVVTVDQIATANITLHPGAVSQVVEVKSNADLMETTNSTVGQLLTASEIAQIPMASRDVYELVQLSDGVSPVNGIPNAADTQAIFNARNGLDVSSYNINGSLQGSVYYMLDGSPIGVAENNGSAIMPAFQVPMDLVDEFRVETQNVPATYQSGGAGVISLVSKSGTNKFHGDGFVFIRPDAFASNDYFVKQSQIASGQPNVPNGFYRYQEGGAFGGPIKHDKLFFFADYEATQQETLQTATYTVPTAAELTGDFSADSYTIYNPLVPDQANGTRQPFPGNKIPTADLNPVALNYAPFFPQPNQPGIGTYHANNYFKSGLDPNNSQKFDTRLDFYQSERQRIFGRFSFSRNLFALANLYGASNIFNPNYAQDVTNARNGLVADDLTLTPHTILQLRGSFTRHYEDQTGDPRADGLDITTLGFPSSLAAQQVFKDAPLVSFSLITGLGSEPWTTFIFATTTSDGIASLNTVQGKHDINFGFEYQEQLENAGQPVSPSGWYQFDNTPTSSTTYAGDGGEFAAFLIGMGSCPGCEYLNFTKDIFGAQSDRYYAAYGQDNYHILPNLTINLGLRWDIFGGRNERHNRLEYFDPTVAYNVNGVPLTGGEHYVTPGNRNVYTTNLGDFGPRFGLSWQPVKPLVVHGGFSILYGPSPEMVAAPGVQSDGYTSTTSWVSSAYNADGNSVMVNPLNNPFPNGVVQITGSSLGAANFIGNVLSTGFHTQATPATYDFNFGISYQLPYNSVVSAGWVGSRGLYLPLNEEDLNQLSLGTIAQYGPALATPVPNKWEAAYPSTSAFYGQSTVPQWLSLEPYPQFTGGGINTGVQINTYPGGDSIYHSLQVKLQKRMSQHLSTLVAYTWGKIITDDFNPPLQFVGNHGSYQDWRDLRIERSLSPQDQKYNFNWQLSYELPVGKGRALNMNGLADKLLGEWTINSITYFSSGVPIASPSGGTGDQWFNQRPDLNCDPAKGAPHTVTEWMNYTCFSQPASQFLPGTAPAYLSHIRQDGGHDWDASIFKNFPITEGVKVQLQFAAYNVTNSVQLGSPNIFWNQNPTPANMAGFGLITNDVNTPRQLQFAARFTF